MPTMTLWHPFSPQAVGLNEENVPLIHSKPHINAMRGLHARKWQTSAHYLSNRGRAYEVTLDGLAWRFWPTVGREHHYRREYSFSALMDVLTAPPDVTIINMSGHGSRLARHLAAACRTRGKAYIAMIGGVEFTLDRQQTEYYKQAASIITHTRAQKEQIAELLHLPDSKVVAMPLGIDPTQFTPPSMTPPLAELRLLFVGRWQTWKGIHYALMALQQVREVYSNARLTLIGPQSDPDYTALIMKYILEVDLAKHVDILGPLPYDELITWYQQAHFLLLPSAPGKESFGMVMVESLACGTPVVALEATTGGAAEIVTHKVDGLLVQPGQIANEILQAFADPLCYLKMRAAAREKALKQYSLTATIDALGHALDIAMNGDIP